MSRLVGGFVTDEIDQDVNVQSIFMIIKAAESDGSAVWSARSGGDPISSEELLGLLEGLAHSLRSALAQDWQW